MRIGIFGAALAATMLASCGSAVDTAAVVGTIREIEQSQLDSIVSNDLVGIARLYADDAVLVRPDGSVLQGGGAIAEAYGELIEDPNFALTAEPIGGWASAAEDLAVVTSNVDFTASDATGAPVTQRMVSQTAWTRASGSTWKIVSALNSPRGTSPVVGSAAAE